MKRMVLGLVVFLISFSFIQCNGFFLWKPSSSADLKSLTVSSGTLTPSFDRNTTDYTVRVDNGVSSITVTGIPYNSDAEVSASSGQPVPLTVGEEETIEITVTAEDGTTTKTYTITVTRAENSAKVITDFRFDSLSVSGYINQTSQRIIITVPSGTDVTTLSPTIEYFGSSIEPLSGETRDFSDIVIYTVTAADGSWLEYEVIVKIADPAGYIAGYERAMEEVLRGIPESYINTARENYHIAYQHTSHGTHVAYGVFGLQAYKTGDETLFAVSEGSTAVSGKLHFYDCNGNNGEYLLGSISDLSNADSNWSNWITLNRAWLDSDASEIYNVVIWSWCDISNHEVVYDESDGKFSYLEAMQTLIDEYGEGGSKIGISRPNPVTFIFMTGHAYTTNTEAGRPGPQAQLIVDYCEEHGYYCLDYYSIDTHDMDGYYWEDASDDAASSSYQDEMGSSTGNFNQDWQDSHTEGTHWFYNQSSPGGTLTNAYGSHLTQHITSNRKAYAFWWILARIAGWDGSTE